LIQVRLQRLLDERSLSVPRLAKQAGVHPSRVYSLLKDPNRVHLPTLDKVCNALNVTPCDVLVQAQDGDEQIRAMGQRTVG